MPNVSIGTVPRDSLDADAGRNEARILCIHFSPVVSVHKLTGDGGLMVAGSLHHSDRLCRPVYRDGGVQRCDHHVYWSLCRLTVEFVHAWRVWRW